MEFVLSQRPVKNTDRKGIHHEVQKMKLALLPEVAELMEKKFLVKDRSRGGLGR